MSKLIKPSSILLYFLSAFICFFLGILVVLLTGAAKNQGLAGGAIVLFYGVIGSFLGILASLIIAYNFEQSRIVKMNKVLGIFLALFIIVTTVRFMLRDKEKDPKFDNPSRKPTAPVSEPAEPSTPAVLISNELPAVAQNKSSNKMGLGIFKPDFYQNSAMYFYGHINLEKSLMDHTPTDSVSFKRTKYGEFEIATAPPYLVPLHYKMDYGILYFRIKSIGEDFVQIIVNETNGQTGFIARQQGKVILWPEFMLSVNSVEFAEGIENSVHIKPLSHSSTVNTSFEFMQPLLIQNEWMQVLLKDGKLNTIGRGWIEWRSGGELLIRYSLLC